MKKEEEDKDQHNAEDLNSTRMTNSRDKKLTVPFHIPTLTRPQDEFNIFVNNTNQPFEHVWLQRSDDGTRFIHPLEKFSESEFIDIDVGCIEPVKPLPMENTPFKLVEDVKELKQLAAKLRSVNEFAVDLEHNQYRSFQGLTCLMQISTRGEDFVVDTLKLRVHVGPYLREVFKDPSKKKVMHGADRDIVWLQRDFGIYICNLFDTQQASRVLDLERNSLEHLLLYFCGVSVNKVYQNADWRLRPIPDDMLKYAREDTHYLLYIHDLMRRRLFSASVASKGGNDLLLEVYRRSYDVCMQLYEKELLTNESYFHIYGLPEAGFNSQQLSIVAGLCEWRDAVARAEDESTGYILPNKTLLEIARQIPLTVGKLRRLVKSKHPYVEANLDSILGIVKTSIENAASFEYAAQLLMKKHHEMVTEQNTKVASTIPSQQKQMNEQELVNNVNELATKFLSASTHAKYPNLERETVESSRMRGISFQPSGQVGEINKERDGDTLDFSTENMTNLRQPSVMYTDKQNSDSGKALSGVTEEVLDKPGHGFTLRNSALELKLDTDPKVTAGHMDATSAVSSQRERIDDAEGVNKVNGSIHVKTESPKPDLEGIDCSRSSQGSSIQPSGEVEEIKKEHGDHTPNLPNETPTILGPRVTSSDKGNSGLVKHFSGATGEILNNPHHDFGLGNSKLNSKFDTYSKGKVKQIKSLVVLPFQSFICTNEQMKPLAISNNQQNPSPENFIDMLSGTKKFEKMPYLGGYLADLIPLFNFPTALHNDYEHRENAKTEGSVLGAEVKTSLTNLSSRFQKCFHFKREKMNLGQTERAQELESVAQSRLRKDQNEILLTEGEEGFKSLLNLRERHNSSIISRFRKDEVTKDFRQAKQYQSFLRSSSQTFE